jgi:hypothetical protein
MLRSSEWSLHFRFSDRSFVFIYHLSHMWHMTRPSHVAGFDHPNNIYWSVQVMKLLIMQSSPASLRFLPLMFKYSPQLPVSNILSLCSSVNVRDQVSHPYKATEKIIVFMKETERQIDSEQNGSTHFPNLICSSFLRECCHDCWAICACQTAMGWALWLIPVKNSERMNPLDSCQNSLDGGSAHRKASSYTTQKNADIHHYLDRDSYPRSQCSVM